MRAALVTGASRGIGFALARMLAAEGHDLTIASRRPENVDRAAATLRDAGFAVEAVAGDMSSEQDIQEIVRRHRERFGRLDVLVNNAGVGIGATVGEISTKRLDVQLDVNLRSIILFYRECHDLLKTAEGAHVINTASVAGKSGQGWLSVYSAAKAGVIAWTQAMNRELGADRIKSTALAPGFVDTDMTEFIRGTVSAEDMIRPEDIAEMVRAVLRLSPACVIPEIVFNRPGEGL